jgi:hypothetical protein
MRYILNYLGRTYVVASGPQINLLKFIYILIYLVKHALFLFTYFRLLDFFLVSPPMVSPPYRGGGV